jgi:hypothetical protein
VGDTSPSKGRAMDEDYSKREEFKRNKSGGRYCLFISKIKRGLKTLSISRLGIFTTREYERVSFRLRS